MTKYFANTESLRESVASYVSRGFTVATQGENYAIVEKKRKPRIILNLLLSVITSGLWVIVWLYLIITSKRVIRLEVGSAPVASEQSLNVTEILGRLKKSRPAQVAAGLLVVVVAVNVVNGFQGTSPTTSPSASVPVTSSPPVRLPATLGEALGGSVFKPTESLCKELTGAISSVNADRLGSKVAKLERITDPYAASDFLTEYAADYPTSPNTVRDVLRSSLESEVEKQIQVAGVIDEAQLFSVKQRNFDSWLVTAFNETVEGCSLTDSLASAIELEESYQVQITRVSALRDRKPWFPEGYESFSTNLAYQFVRGVGCELGDSCWTINVVSKVSCSTMYAELNIMDSSGAVIDYSNDMARNVEAMQTVRMQFPTYNSSADTGRLTEINCY